MSYEREKQTLVEVGLKIYRNQLTRGTGGNLSLFIKDKNLMVITPSGLPYEEVSVEDMVVATLDGKVIEGHRKPSSEFQMHAEVYRKRPEFTAMIHTHSTYAVTLSSLRKDLPAIDYLVAVGGGKDVKVAKYASFGSQALADNAIEAMTDRSAVLLANHGINVAADTLQAAYDKLVVLEFCCEIYVKGMSAGQPVILEDQEMNKMVKDFEHYGQK
jgi:L-fuculose-phosphate aldolase